MTTTAQNKLPQWILIVSALFALMEIGVGVSLFFNPQSIADKVDLTAKGVNFLILMWATRQFALGVIFAVAVIKKSRPMLTLAYVFFAIMFAGDAIVGMLMKETPLMISGVMMSLVALTIILFVNKKD
ncbi:MAG: hypothetical protein JSS79_15540 [Bacteroidetes bacterium]|nr:hypothetical protein [Bacteroidota bacterium]